MAGEFRLDIRKKLFTKVLVDIGMGCRSDCGVTTVEVFKERYFVPWSS